jgi:hypothetical protein
MRALWANRYPTKVGDRPRMQLGKNAFVHRNVTRGWTEEWTASAKSGRCLGLMTARMCLALRTSTEIARMLDPVGTDRGPFDLAQKHGMRDAYLCPMGTTGSGVLVAATS